MKTRLGKWGNSAAVRLPKAVVDELGLAPGQELDIEVGGGEARIRPHAATRRQRLQELVAEMKRLGPENQPPMVDQGELPSEWPDYEGPGPDEWEDATSGSR